MTRKALLIALIFSLYIVHAFFPAFSSDPYASREVEGVEVLFSGESLELGDVLDLRSPDFRPVPENIVRFWDLGAKLWLRVPMEKVREAERPFLGDKTFLGLESEYISLAEFYMPTSHNGFRQSSHGMRIPVELRGVPSRNPIFSLPRAYNKGYAYLKVETKLPISFIVTVQNEDSYYSQLIQYMTSYMAFYGFLIATLLIGVFFYLMTGDPCYSILVVRQLGMFLFLFSISGYLQYYANLNARVLYILCALGIGMYFVMTSFLYRRLLRADEGPVWLRRLISVNINFSVVTALTSFVVWTDFQLLLTLLVFVTDILSFLTLGYIRLRQGYRSVFIFLLSRLAFLMGSVTLVTYIIFMRHMFSLEACFMSLYMLDPILLLAMMIPDSRKRFKIYFSLTEKEAYEPLEERDSVTGLYNKANLMTLLEDNVEAAQKNAKPLALMIMDIDHFQEYNDAWGYPEGEKLLLFLAKLIRQSLRESDIAARYGGGEFCIVLPGGTLPSAVLVAERIRQTFEKQTGAPEKARTTTLSLGLSFLKKGDTTAALSQRGYEALRLAKNNGRNRTEFEILAAQDSRESLGVTGPF